MKKQDKIIDDLWMEFTKTKDPEIKNKLVEHYFPFVKKIANKMAEQLNYHVTADELASSGVDGLYRAIDKYQISRGVKFESYSQRRIGGSMIDWLRKGDIIPRSVRMNHNKWEKTKQKLQSEKGRRVTDDEVAVNLGVPMEFCKNKKKFQPVSFASLEGVYGDNNEQIKQDSNFNMTDKSAPDPGGRMRRIEFFSKLLGRNFSRTEKKIIYLYYYLGLTMDMVADRVGLSESRVSQMHKRILPRLKDKIARNPQFFQNIGKYIVEINHKDAIF